MIVFVIMLIVPALFALVIHSYLRHGDVSTRRKMVFFVVYAALINAICYMVSRMRGIAGFDYTNMTLSYRLKYLGLGCVLGFVVPFVVCLATEDVITLGGFKRYIARFIGDLKRFLPYAIWSAKADLGAEVASSYLNWMWWLIEPVCMMLIYTFVFGIIFNAKEEYFPIFVFSGITMWNFFSRSVIFSVNAVRAGKGIITNIYMPKHILLLSKMFVNVFKMMISFGVIIIMMIVYRVPVNASVLWTPLILIVLFLFTFGVGTIMMHYGVYVNDLGYITGIVLQMMMYLSGVFYSVSKRIPEPFGEVLEKFNPMACIMSLVRNTMLYRVMPPVGLLAVWTLLSIILIALGVFTVYSNENAYVKVI